jgi:ribonuclease HI
MSPPVLGAPKTGDNFKLYVTAQEHIIAAVLMQEEGCKECAVAYLSRRLTNAKTRYTSLKKLCLSLYYACIKLRRNLLMSTCTVVCQYDIIKCMLQKQILSGRLGKWAYSLVEYDIKYEPLKAKKGQVLADLLTDHRVDVQGEVCVSEEEAWTLFFDGSVCSQGCGVGFLVISPGEEEYEFSTRLEFECTNNQAEYEALLSGIEVAVEMGAMTVKILGDSMLTVQQMKGESQCLEVLEGVDRFSMEYIPWGENHRANALAQQVSGYDIRRGMFGKGRKPEIGDVLAIQEKNEASADRED